MLTPVKKSTGHHLDWFPRASSVVLFSLGTVVLLGWQFNVEFLLSILHGLPPMVPNTALCFMLTGSALWLLVSHKQSRQKIIVARLFGLLAFLIGALTLLEYTSSEKVVLVDNLMAPLFSHTPYVLRSSPHTSIAFTFSGLALFLMGSRTARTTMLIQWLSLTVLFIAVVVIFGYIYGEIPFYAYNDLIGMSLHSSIGLIFLSIGILTVHPNVGIISIISSNTAGGIVLRRLFPAIVLVPLTLGGFIMLGRKAGLYTEEFGTSLLQALSVIVMAIVVAHVVRILNREEMLRQRAEKQARLQHDELAHLHRLNIMNEMASSLAHEINQPLTAISTYLYTCIRKLRKLENVPDDVMSSMERIDSSTNLAAEIVRRMREFVQKQKSEKSDINVNELIKETIKFIEHDLRSNQIDLDINVEENLPEINVDHIQIEQVLLNLLRNAIDAVETARRKTITVHAFLNSRGKVQLDICDTGPGLNNDTLARIFEPFFSTKSASGMGMGLSISRSIIESHGGSIWADSEQNIGTCVSFSLPL